MLSRDEIDEIIKPENFIGRYPSVYDSQLQYSLFKKQEFHDLKLPRFEARPSLDGNFSHQLIIQRFLSGHTLYNVLLLIHGLGTGKTRTSILVAEINRRVPYSSIQDGKDRRPLVLTRNKLLHENYQEELIKYDQKFLPLDDRGQPIDPIRESKRYNTERSKLTKKYYEFNTFAKFATLLRGREETTRKTKGGKIKKVKAVKALTDEEIIDRYSHRVIIIDEAHNIRTTSAEEEDDSVSTEVYDEIHRFLHLIKNSKILLMTATPIWDQPREIASLMNLILPEEEQLDYDGFDTKYFSSDGKLKNKSSLRRAFYGRVSYLRQMQSEVVRDYQGVRLEGGKATGTGLKISPSAMSRFQYEIEKKAAGSAEAGEGSEASEDEDETQAVKAQPKAFYINERNAANFVFPDGTFRREGFDKNVEPITEVKKGTDAAYRFQSHVDKRELKENLSKYSAKYADTIAEITSHPNENAFVFFEYLKGSNAIVFGLLLELFGYRRVLKASAGIFAKPEKRYAIVSGETSDASDLIRAFNDPRNKNGDYIQVLIGTPKMAQGVTLKNVLQTHIEMPHWHTAYIDQAIGRTIRLGSHADLDRPEVKVKIFLHASTFKDRETIDLKLYRLSEEKDFLGAQIYREAKISSFDCPLTYARNVHPTDQPNTRDCEYQECNYRCLQFPEGLITPNELSPRKVDRQGLVYEYNIPEDEIDPTTNALFYRANSQNRITTEIERLFRMRDVLTFEELAATIPKRDVSILLFSLENLIDDRITVMDRFGFQSSLQQKDNEYFLSERSRGIVVEESGRTNFTESSIVIRDEVSLSDIVEVFRLDEEKSEVLRLCDETDEEEIARSIRDLSYRTRIVLLEGAFAAGGENAERIIEELRKANLIVFEIDNNELITRTFAKFRKDINKYRNLPSYITKLWEFSLTYVPIDRIQDLFEDLRTYVANRRDPNVLQNLRKTIDKIEKRVKESVRSDVTHVHALFGIEPQATQYKRTLHVTGLMRCFDPINRLWQFCPYAREVEYVQYIKDIETVAKEIPLEDNPYGVHGTIDPLHNDIFRIVEKGAKTKGFVCASMSDKSKLIRIIIALRDKERELEGDTTLTPKINETALEMDRSQLVRAILAYEQEHKNLGPLKKSLKDRSEEDLREIESLLNSNLRNTLCPLIHNWLERKDLIVRV